MLFNSYTFLVFFVVVLVVTRLIGNWTWRKLFLLFMSYIFYAAWNPPFVILLIISTLVDWFASRVIYRSENPAARKVALVVSLMANLGLLGYFKYGDFMIDNFNQLMASFSITWHAAKLNVILPVGISFYTFQTMSYTIDVYRRKFAPSRSFIDYALYVTFFPQLVAGPIVRADEFLPQCEEPRKGTREQISWGLVLLAVGLFSKIVLADEFAAPIVEKVYDNTFRAGFLSAWTGTLAFSMQIFYDFFGYSTCAIGAALCLGFWLPENFRFPYAALGLSDFWKRWHVSLSSWLKDYVYVSVGGNRGGTISTYCNLLFTMLLGGLWHGASWLFVIWGGMHGLYLVLERAVKKIIPSQPIFSRWYARGAGILLTFFLVTLTWVFFRAGLLSRATALISTMLSPAKAISFAHSLISLRFDEIKLAEPLWLARGNYLIIFILTFFTLAYHFLMRDSSFEKAYEKVPRFMRVAVLTVMIYMTLTCMSGQDNAFIYFQF